MVLITSFSPIVGVLVSHFHSSFIKPSTQKYNVSKDEIAKMRHLKLTISPLRTILFVCLKVKPSRWGDLLQIQAPESYSLLAIKSLAFLSWTQRILPQVSNQLFHQLCHLQTKIDLFILPERFKL